MSFNLENDSKKIDFIFSYSTHVLRKLLFQKYGIDLSHLCKVIEKTPEIEIKLKNKSYFLYSDLVDKDYIFDINIILNNIDNDIEKENIKNEIEKHLTFLVNAINSTYEYLKRTIKKAKEENEYFLILTKLTLDDGISLYLNENDSYKIGIKIRQ